MSFEIANSEDVLKLIRSVNEMKSQFEKQNMEKILGEWVDAPFACKKLKICRRTLSTYIATGDLKAARFGRKILFKLADLEEFIIKGYR
jgi:excisionase family DNA binding protein